MISSPKYIEMRYYALISSKGQFGTETQIDRIVKLPYYKYLKHPHTSDESTNGKGSLAPKIGKYVSHMDLTTPK